MKCKKAHAYQRKINNVTVLPLAPREVDPADMDFPALPAVDLEVSSGLYAQTAKKLRSLKLFESYEGQLALKLAYRIDMPSADTGSSIAALSKELRQLMASLMSGSAEALDPLDELQRRRDLRNAGA